MATQIVREFSVSGPCLTVGELIRETPRFYVYREWLGGQNFGTQEKRIAKGSNAHVEACHCCRDHAKTSYPNGYMG